MSKVKRTPAERAAERKALEERFPQASLWGEDATRLLLYAREELFLNVKIKHNEELVEAAIALRDTEELSNFIRALVCRLVERKAQLHRNSRDIIAMLERT